MCRMNLFSYSRSVELTLTTQCVRFLHSRLLCALPCAVYAFGSLGFFYLCVSQLSGGEEFLKIILRFLPFLSSPLGFQTAPADFTQIEFQSTSQQQICLKYE